MLLFLRKAYHDMYHIINRGRDYLQRLKTPTNGFSVPDRRNRWISWQTNVIKRAAMPGPVHLA